MKLFGTKEDPTKVLEDILAKTQARCAEAERQRDDACKDLAEAQSRLAVVQRELSDARRHYYEAIGRYDQGQIDAVHGGGR